MLPKKTMGAVQKVFVVTLLMLLVSRCEAMNGNSQEVSLFYKKITQNDLPRIIGMSEEIDANTVENIKSCLKSFVTMEQAFQVCKRHMRVMQQLCLSWDFGQTWGNCKVFLKNIRMETDQCTKYGIQSELCQFLTMLKKAEDKKQTFESVTRLTKLVEQSLQNQQQQQLQPQQNLMCFQSNPFKRDQRKFQEDQWRQCNTAPQMKWKPQQQQQQTNPQEHMPPQGLNTPQKKWLDEYPQHMMSEFSKMNHGRSQMKLNFEQVYQQDLQAVANKVHTLGIGDVVQVHTLPVGQGDCNIITCNGGKNVIIFDCGSIGGFDKKIFSLIKSYFTRAKFVAILISHGHYDHYNKITNILKILTDKGGINTIAILGGESKDYPGYLKNILKAKTHNRIVYHDNLAVGNLCVDDTIYFDFIEAREVHAQGSDINQKGMLMKLSCKHCQSSLLFSGDMQGKVADHFAMGTNLGKEFLRSTHYKMAHHGASDTANRAEWLKAISPVEVHVSHMYNHGSFHHPRCEAYERVKENCPIGTNGPIPHAFTCFDRSDHETNKYVTKQKKIWYRIYSTAPTKDDLCLISLVFARGLEARTGYKCVQNANKFF